MGLARHGQSPAVADAVWAAAIDALHQATAVYTREPVAEQLLRSLSWPSAPGMLVDPSCGDGVFLVAALRLVGSAIACDDVEALTARLQGWEIHPAAANAARARVTQALRGSGWTASVADMASRRLVITGDFLTESDPSTLYAAIATNPPYLRRVGVPELLRRRYDEAMPPWARADMLHAFLAHCARKLTEDGEIGMVTADRWLFGAAAATLRERIGADLVLSDLRRLDAASAFHRPKDRRTGTPARVHPVVIRLTREGGRTLTREPIYPDVWDEAQHTGATLADHASIRLAPWLGPHGAFVVDADSPAAAALPRAALVPAVDTDDVRDGVLGAPTRYAIRTGPDCPTDPELIAHLHRERHRLPARALRGPWWLPPEPWHRFDLREEALLVPRITRTLRAVRVPAGTLPINHNLTIVRRGTATLDEIEALLQSDAANAWIRARAARLENGFLSVTTTLLRQLPWPTPTNDQP